MYIIYHNPRCSKSREALLLLHDKGINPTVKQYLTDSLTKKELQELELLLNMPLISFVRTNEKIYKELGKPTEQDLYQAVIAHPILLQRPIIIKNKKGVIGRPIEQLLQII